MTNSIWNHYVKTVQHELYCPAYSCTVMCFKHVTSKTAISILKTTRIPNKKQLRYWRKFSVSVIILTINDLCKSVSVFWQEKICSWLKSAVLMFISRWHYPYGYNQFSSKGTPHMACLEKKWPWENDFNSKNKASVTQKSYLREWLICKLRLALIIEYSIRPLPLASVTLSQICPENDKP